MLDVSTVGSLAQTLRSNPAATGETRHDAKAAIPVAKSEAVDKTDAKPKADGVGETARVVQQAQENASLSPNTRLSILFDDGANLFVSRSVENKTGEVVNQFPPEQFVKRVAALVENLRADNKPKLSFSA